MLERKNINRREFLKQAAAGAIIASFCCGEYACMWRQKGEPVTESEVKKVRLSLTGKNCLICPPWVGVDMECELVFTGEGNLEAAAGVANTSIREVTVARTFEEWSSMPEGVLEKLIIEKYEENRAFYNQHVEEFCPGNVKLVSVKILTFRLSPGGPHWPPVRK